VVTKQAALVADLESKIAAGELGPGALVPTEHELRTGHGVSRQTVRDALRELEDRGIIDGAPASGQRRRVPVQVLLPVHLQRDVTRVYWEQAPTGWAADSWAHDVALLGHEPGEQIAVTGVAARQPERDYLRLSKGAVVVMRDVLRLVDGKPHNEVAYLFPRWVADSTDLAGYGNIPQGSTAYLAEIGHQPVTFRVRMRTRMASDGERDRLKMPRAVPVLVVWRTGHQSDGRPVYCSREVYPGNRVELIGDF
jgi:GntR family transcriptional regulator